MKIITWNVNGIRAALGKRALDWAFAQQPDALCLQEVKARPEQLSDEQREMLKLPFAWNPAERAGYSGVTTFYKEQPQEIVMGLGDTSFDVEGRVIQTVQSGLRLFNIYFPNGSVDKSVWISNWHSCTFA
ncbi:MAG: exodeoxyribonuclease III [Anaerolineales bacterium]